MRGKMPQNLKDVIAKRIKQDGPLTVAEYMGLCLGHPKYGYYITRDPFGEAGDFTTAPEISQVFGEMIGAWLVQLWRDIQKPKSFTLLELGPGRGTLMADILRITSKIAPDFYRAADVHLVETSPVLKEKQAETLKDHDVNWHSDLSDVDFNRPLLCITNEFFDALPVHQFIWSDAKKSWQERYVGLSTENALEWHVSSPSFDPRFIQPEPMPREGDVMEFSPLSVSIMKNLCDVIAATGGGLLAVDYGYANSTYGNTLQALSGHQYCNPLKNPGEADITYHVDFERLAQIATELNLEAMPIIGQGAFLTALGAEYRAEQLCSLNVGDQKDIMSGVRRLIDADQMGRLFKVLGIAQRGVQPVGFENVYSP